MNTGFRTGQVVNPVSRGHIAFRNRRHRGVQEAA
jgi:hypothetical protein